jgi:hypothetical protein
LKNFLEIIPGIFANNQLTPQHSETLLRIPSYNIAVFISLFICCALFIYVYLHYYKKILQIFSSVVSYGTSQQIQREGFSFLRSFSICLFLIYILSCSIFFTDLSIHLGWFKNLPTKLITILCIIGITTLILVKAFLGNILGLIIKEKNATDDSFFQYTSNIYIGGLVIFVVCLLLHYSNFPSAYLFPIGIGIGALFFIFRTLKTVAFGYLQYGFSVFHLVLYLCAVEIIPLAIFVKIIVRS